MKIVFYQNKSNNDKIKKEISLIKEITTFNLKDNTSIINPSIVLHKDVELLKANYCMIDYDTINRYYYIDNITLSKGGLINIELSIDVLMSHADAILDSSAYIERCESSVAYNKYLNDSYFPIQTKREVTVSIGDGANKLKSFDTTCNNYLVVTGGSSGEE